MWGSFGLPLNIKYYDLKCIGFFLKKSNKLHEMKLQEMKKVKKYIALKKKKASLPPFMPPPRAVPVL